MNKKKFDCLFFFNNVALTKMFSEQNKFYWVLILHFAKRISIKQL